MTFAHARLKYLCRLVAGGTPAVDDEANWADEDHGFAWVSISDMSAAERVKTTGRRISEAGVRDRRLIVAPRGTLLFSMYASLGHTAVLDVEGTWNQAILGLLSQAHVDMRFVRYALISLRPHLGELARSNTQANLNAEQVGNLSIPLPPLDEQRRIADFLDTEIGRLDRLVAGQKIVGSLLTEREQALIDSLVEKLRDEFGTVPLRRFVRRIEQGSSPQCDNVEAAPDEWGVLKVSAVKSGRFEPGENKLLPDGEPPLKQYEIKDGDLLVTRANTPLLVGATAVVRQPPRRLLLCDKIFRVDLDPSLDKDFVALVARSTPIRAMCAEASHGTSQSMANLKTEEIKGWPMPVAPLVAQRDALQRIAADSDAITRLQMLIYAQLGVLAERRQALITAAVTGQFDVTTARGADVP